MKNETALIIKSIISLFASLNGQKFVGIREYTSGLNNKKCIVPEIANHVICANFSYGNAVKNDLAKLRGATDQDISEILENSNYLATTSYMIRKAIDKLIASFEKNLNLDKTKRSNQSQAQTDVYLPITNSMKLHIETGKIHIYGLAHSKNVIENGEYEPTNSRELTMCQNAVKKYFDFRTSKFRQFIVNRDQLSAVKISGENIELV